jgi:hypothetical protein
MTSVHKQLCKLLSIPVSESTQNWYAARNKLLGLGYIKSFDFEHGALLAKKSSHPDAIWITNLFKAKIPTTKAEFRELLSTDLEDSRALVYTYCLREDGDNNRINLEKAIDLKNAFALTFVGTTYKKDEKLALQDEPGGWYKLYIRKKYSSKRKLVYLRRAAFMNNISAQSELLDYYGHNHERGLYWAGRLALQGDAKFETMLVERAFTLVWAYEHPNNWACTGVDNLKKRLFDIGRILDETILRKCDAIKYEKISVNKIKVASAHISIGMYKKWSSLTKNAVDAWSFFAIKMTMLPRDIRLMISKLIWKSRSEALYNIDSKCQLL